MTRDDSIQARITGFWSMVAVVYEAHGANVPKAGSAEFDAWVRAIRELLPPAPADVLDIGTGTGFVALIAASLGQRVTGIDLSEAMLAEARSAATKAGLDVRFALLDAVSPPLEPRSLDAIVCRHFIWTLREPERAFRNWRELLRPGGRLVAIDGYWFRAEAEPTEGGKTREQDLFDHHYTPDTRAALPMMGFTNAAPLVAMLERAGFEDVEVSDLAGVHALAEDPPSAEPWYVVVARR